MRSVQELECEGQKVFYRTDYNLPLNKGEIVDDYRIQATRPTLNLLMEKGAKIIIGTHLGRPDGHFLKELELRPVAERLADLYPKKRVYLANRLIQVELNKSINQMEGGDILLLPNLRFYKEEEANNEAFARDLADLADYYVNDAFACDHRAHASIVGVPSFLPAYAGLLVQREVEKLGALLEKPEHPFVLIMGGAKVSDKIEVIRRLTEAADRVLIGGAMANTFLAAKGEPVSESLYEKEKLDLADNLMESLGEKLVLAESLVKENRGDGRFSYLDIAGPSIEKFKESLKGAKTIFWNGSLGRSEDERYARGTEAIAEYIGSLKDVVSVVAGGDTVEMIHQLNLQRHFSFVSTGGGAALDFLAGEKLPGLLALEKAVNRHP